MARGSRIVLGIAAGMLALTVALVAIVALMDWNWLKPTINRRLGAMAHRTVEIQGDLSVRWVRQREAPGWHAWIPWPAIQARDIVVGNPEWAQTGPDMVRAQSLSLVVDPWQLRHHVVHLDKVEVKGGKLVLERDAQGRNNWTFGPQDDKDKEKGESAWRVETDTMLFDDAVLRVVEAGYDVDVAIAFSPWDTAQNDRYWVSWELDGTYRGVPVQGEGALGDVMRLREGDEPLPVKGYLESGQTRVAAEGILHDPTQLAGIDVQFELAGHTMGELYPLLGIALPNTPPYTTQGHLVGRLEGDRRIWDYQDFTGRVGKSDLAGSLTYDMREPRPLLTGELTSSLLRFKDLGPLIGAETADDVPEPDLASESDHETKTEAEPDRDAEKQADATAAADSDEARSPQPPPGKALPVDEAEPGMWGAMDADVRFEGKQIVSNADLPLDNVKTRVTLEDRVLKLRPLDFGVAGGTLATTITLDGTQAEIQAALNARARGLQLAKLFPGVESMDAALGSVHGDATLQGHGNSVAEMMRHASGELHAVVSRGTVSHFLLEAAGLNVANMVLVKLFGDEQIMLECLLTDFEVKDGLVQTRAFVLETEDAVVNVEGQINLATEDLHLDVYPENKSLRIFTLRSPLYVRGTFKDPDVGVQTGPVAARAGAAVALGVLATPLAALIPLLNPGTADESHCSAAGSASGKDGGGGPGRVKGSVRGAEPTRDIEP